MRFFSPKKDMWRKFAEQFSNVLSPHLSIHAVPSLSPVSPLFHLGIRTLLEPTQFLSLFSKCFYFGYWKQEKYWNM